MDAFDHWKKHFADTAPVGHLLRAAVPERWLRIHSLQASKRYPESDIEYRTMLDRHNQVACEILGADQDVLVFNQAWGERDLLFGVFETFGWSSRTGLLGAPHVEFPAEGEDTPIVVSGCSIRWSPGAWNDLLRDVADDRGVSVAFMNPTSGEVYAPYDGGADLFVRDADRVIALKQRWAAWLSGQPSGL